MGKDLRKILYTITNTLCSIQPLQGSYDNGGSGGTDYTNDLANCLKEWVGAEIDDSLWRQATPLHGDAIKAVGEIHTLLNGSSEITLTPYQIMDKSQTHYERINQDRRKTFEQVFL